MTALIEVYLWLLWCVLELAGVFDILFGIPLCLCNRNKSVNIIVGVFAAAFGFAVFPITVLVLFALPDFAYAGYEMFTGCAMISLLLLMMYYIGNGAVPKTVLSYVGEDYDV